MDYESLRREINAADEAMLQLMLKRLALEEAAMGENRSPAEKAALRRETLRKMTELAGDKEQEAWLMFNTLFSLEDTRADAVHGGGELTATVEAALERGKGEFPRSALVACQGTEGANSQAAAEKLFPRGNLMYFKTFEAVFDAVASGLCKYGVLPIENSSYGSVTEVYDLKRKYRFSIVRSVRLKIDHRLLAKPGTKLEDIREIVSHEQAIGQCSEFLKKLSGVKVTVCENTAVAAQMVSSTSRNDIAAISAPACAALYGLSVLKTDISNSDSNFTRFICIAKQLEIYPGANKMSLMLNVQHKPGALYSMIAKFSALGLNLTKLESRPLAGTDFEFMFYFDLDASVYDEAALQLLSELDAGPETFTYLGSYSEI